MINIYCLLPEKGYGGGAYYGFSADEYPDGGDGRGYGVASVYLTRCTANGDGFAESDGYRGDSGYIFYASPYGCRGEMALNYD